MNLGIFVRLLNFSSISVYNAKCREFSVFGRTSEIENSGVKNSLSQSNPHVRSVLC